MRGLQRVGCCAAVLVLMTAAVAGSSGVAAASAASASNTRFCDRFEANSLLGQQLFLTDAVSQEASAKALAAKLRSGTAAAAAVAPAAISAAYRVVADASDPEAQVDFAALTDAMAAVDGWVVANCRYEVVKITAGDSSVSAPKTVKPGFVAFAIDNTGTSGRFYGVVPVAAGQSPDQIVGSTVDQLRPKLIAEVRTSPGQKAVAYGRVTKPGVYVVVDGDSLGAGPPSYTTFTVKK